MTLMSKYIVECDECLSTYMILDDQSEESDLIPENCCMCASLIKAELIEEDIEEDQGSEGHQRKIKCIYIHYPLPENPMLFYYNNIS